MMDDVITISSDSDSDVEFICFTSQPDVVICDDTKCIVNLNNNLTPLKCNFHKSTDQPAPAPTKGKERTNRKRSFSSPRAIPSDQDFYLDHYMKQSQCDSPPMLASDVPNSDGVLHSTAPHEALIDNPLAKDCLPDYNLVQLPSIKKTRQENVNGSQPSQCPANPVSSVQGISVMTVEADDPKNKENYFSASSPSSSKDESEIDPMSLYQISHNPTFGDDTLFTSSVDGLNRSDGQSEQVKGEGSSPANHWSKCLSGGSPLSITELEDKDCATMADKEDLRNDGPLYIEWENEDLHLGSRSDEDSSDAFQTKTQFVCPVALNQIMSGRTQTLAPLKDETLKPSQILSRQMLNLISCTIDESYTEGTLQLLSDFLQPGYHPPKSITNHLLCGILLNPQSTRYHCVCAFNLLMKTQRHHMVDRNTVPWSWDLLTSVMNTENPVKMLRSEVVRMFLEYVLQTLTDDYLEKRTNSDLHNSIAKATLSCDQHFGQVRDVIKWICAVTVKSSESGDTIEAAKENDEQMRIVSGLQRMLSLALDVDQCPALISSKLCQELFNTLITSMPLRAHRMMFLESLQSQPLRCKLLEQLLEYSCPVKVCLPMSLGLLLHFLRNCTPIPDLKCGAEKWRDWDELLQLLWMLLLSYNKTMKGYLSSSASTHSKSSNMIFKKEDRLTKAAVCEGVDTFRSRSRNDLGTALPLHVEESLSYLTDYLLGVCQD